MQGNCESEGELCQFRSGLLFFQIYVKSKSTTAENAENKPSPVRDLGTRFKSEVGRKKVGEKIERAVTLVML